MISRRLFVASLAAMPLAMSALPSHAAIVGTEEAMTDLVYGKADAPVTIIEYASLACPHCADFHENTFPKIKEAFIDTGKVKFIYRDFPLGAAALAASMISRCAGPKRHAGMVDLLFKSQKQWARAEDPVGAIAMVARMGGLGPSDVQACIRNGELMSTLQKRAQEAADKNGINSTPSFLVNGTLIAGAQPFEEFKKAIEAALKKAQ